MSYVQYITISSLNLTTCLRWARLLKSGTSLLLYNFRLISACMVTCVEWVGPRILQLICLYPSLSPLSWALGMILLQQASLSCCGRYFILLRRKSFHELYSLRSASCFFQSPRFSVSWAIRLLQSRCRRYLGSGNYQCNHQRMSWENLLFLHTYSLHFPRVGRRWRIVSYWRLQQ